jgi:hypothetical protein
MNNDDNTQTAVAEPPPAATEPNPFAERAAAEAKQPKKASLLDSITTRKRRRPFFGVLYGPHGAGKSTFGASLPKPVVIQAERGLDSLTVPRFPLLRSLADYKQQIQALLTEPHDYESIIIDTADGLHLLIEAEVCRIGKVDELEAYGGGWQKGQMKAKEIWVKILDRLTEMSERWNILIIGHSVIKSINDPSLGTPYDQWKMRLPDKSQDVIKQAVDLIMFVNLARTIDKESPKSRRGRAIVSDDRELWTSPTTGIECKNRFSLSSPMEFSWEALEKGINDFYDK